MTEPQLVQPAPPEISEFDATAIARDVFGVDGRARSLGSNQDRNFVIETDAAPRLLKLANPATTAAELEAQSRAAALIADAGVRAPRAHRFSDGSTVRAVEVGGVALGARLLDFLDGSTLSGSHYLSPAAIDAIGQLAASVDRSLAGLSAPGADRATQWDLRHAPDVLAALLPSVADATLRARLRDTADAAWEAVAAVADTLPVQPIHGDLTDDNVVAGADGLPDGVIDLGDLVRTWRASEPAITLSSLLHHDGVGLVDAVRAVSAYHSALPLEAAELDALWPLVVVRAAVLVASGHHVLRTDPGNAYAADNLAHEERILDAATSVPLAVGTALVRRAVGADAAGLALPRHGALLAGVDAAEVAVLDLSAASPLLHEGRWLVDGVETTLAAEALDAGARVVATRFAEPRLTRSRPSQHEPANVVLGVELTARTPVELVAPWSGRVRHSATGVTVTTEAGLRLSVCTTPSIGGLEGASGPEPGLITVKRRSSADVVAGDPVGRFSGAVRITVDAGADLPEAVTASLAPAWRAVAADPTPLLFGGTTSLATTRPLSLSKGDLLARRTAHFAAVQEHYFADPPVIVRGWREHLLDADARVYLDTLNNVTSIGHGHPRLAAAVAEQWRLLNTNSRFLYPAVVEFSERLAELLPDGLDHVFLVNSGSEAVDLALRLARAHTARRDILAVREAYHGWTDLTDAVSTSVADNPNALATRPEWVHTVDAPNSFRGRHRDDPARYARDAVAEVERLAAAGTPVGAFLAETLYGNAGGIALPDGYLDAVYTAVRAHGGVAVADEVQVGYGRLGEWFWGFEQQGVVPDIVAVAKAMGNGHPLGAVVTTREIAESYRNEGYFFSSAGGSPVSSVVGLTVLDVIRDEQLQRNARETGAYLKGRLLELGERHPLLGAVHGHGFYLGPELVRDGDPSRPATEATAAICERMRRLGVMVQPTGDHQNVLKIKPPMCFTRDSADAFVDALDRVLTTGW
ncbi:MAG: aminotransferase [Microbacterium sp.]|uniref:aminotransferase n=1 Tax=Microbacterium sp. TaxID=51671 RepID=UPI0039E61CB3